MIIKTPSRLHMTLIDLNGSYGRADGGIGLTINKPNFTLRCDYSESGISIDFNEKITDEEIRKEAFKKISMSAEKVISKYNFDEGFHFTVEEAYPPHSGLGSGTQMSLATAKLICEFNEKKVDSIQLGSILGRGGSSGIGMGAFDYGGFVVDGGHDLKDKGGSVLPSSVNPAKPPQLIGRYDFPEDWEIVVAISDADTTVTGMKEDDIFEKYCPVPKNDVEKLSHIIFMNLIPFLLEKNIESVGDSINIIQKLGFKNIEVSRQSQNVRDLMDNMRQFGAYGVGMSSFGPAIYGLIDKHNQDVFKATQDYLGDDGIVFKTKAQNHGFEIEK
ncbi:ribofuranosylaminobenzene 5`-phosphate synthase [Methanobrevibacter arboriphilus JCM 13429 = DSM 1125]|uniref:Beta-ribofuranosylaminobenzene 5'-phosphate synthase n=1 Tax=Methanobrevibacter arboriphilus JCM 13429 = DSM 1125 TaxID=1300164 RepID=A0A1V6N3U1_METAZ|nr:beta-ribofuranosylaminobenzene 5'-phosphate synthase [Methanobrevibacter arboriphilus]OQD59334.1 ribofuranosylaminobenzene 5`-phosphate synthase [Methanobrevibacter arboriphilus JCM 13429 = DSM 1125]